MVVPLLGVAPATNQLPVAVRLRGFAPAAHDLLLLRNSQIAMAVVADLIRHLNIPADQKPVVTCNGRVLKANDILPDGGLVQIFQPVAGG